MARRKAQSGSSCLLLGDMLAPLGAPYRGIFFGIGPRFPLPAMAGRSASSWQGTPIGPGGELRHRPSARLRETSPRAPHLVPPHDAS